MEIILDNAKYVSNNMNESLINVSYTFKNSITFCSGIKGIIIKELLFMEKKLESGYILLSNRGYKYDVSYLSNNKEIFNKECLYDELLYLNKYYNFNYENVEDRIDNALKIANVSNSLLTKKFEVMSNTEIKICRLVISLFINSKIIILDNFEKNLSYKYMEYIKKLVIKLNKSYNKTIIIFSDDLDCYLKIIEDIVIFKKGKVVFKGNKNNLYDNSLYKYIDKPKIIEFINYLDDNGHKFDNYLDLKELLKAIYRDVENK